MNIRLLFHKHKHTLQPGVICFFTLTGSPLGPERQSYFEYLSKKARATGLETRIVETDRPEFDGLTAARRFNLGNFDTEAVSYIRADVNMAFAGYSVQGLIWSLNDVLSIERGSADLTASQTWSYRRSAAIFADDDAPLKPQESKDIHLSEKNFRCEVETSCSMSPESTEEEAAIDELERQRVWMMDEISKLIREYAIQFHAMPPIKKLIYAYQSNFLISADLGKPFSPVVVNGNLDIVLPYYNELIIKLTPLPKIVYLLFLVHPEGLRLKDIGDYKHELEELYLLVKPGADEQLARTSIADLCNPLSESLNQKLSMIRRAIRVQLGRTEFVEYYSIGGQRGDTYRLPAASGEVTLPGAVRSL